MNLRRAAGHVLTAALVALSGAGIAYLTGPFFDTARNSDGAWDDALLLFAVIPCFLLGAATAVLGVCACACEPSDRRVTLAVTCSACSFVVPLLGCAAGGYLWQREFALNRRYADEVIEALQRHREKYGDYPASLADLEVPVTTTFRRGRHTHELEYHRGEEGGFVLQYQYGYGWYCYRYKSDQPGWSRFD